MVAARRWPSSAPPILSCARCAPHEPHSSARAPKRLGACRAARPPGRRTALPALRLLRPAEADGVQESLPQLRHGLSPRGLFRLTVDLSRDPLPAPLRPGASLTVLDITEYFSATSGGIRTYLLAKAAWVSAQEAYRQVIVYPTSHDDLIDGPRTRLYGLRGPRLPLHPPYRLLLS